MGSAHTHTHIHMCIQFSHMFAQRFTRHMMLLCAASAAESLHQCTTYETFHAFFTLTVPPVFVETMMQVADRFDGPSGVDSVVLSLPYRISEAMLTMMDNIEAINSKVRARIGTHIQLHRADQTIQTISTTQNSKTSNNIMS